MDRVKKVIYNAVLLVVLLQFSVGVLFSIFSRFLCGIIATSQDVVEMAMIRLVILGSMYFMCGIMEVFANSCRAMGKPIFALIVSVMGATVFRLIFLKITFTLVPEFYMIFLSYPASWLFTITVYLIVLPSVYRKTKVSVEKKKELCYDLSLDKEVAITQE